MKALITGGAGFVGSHLAEALTARGDEVHVIDEGRGVTKPWTSMKTPQQRHPAASSTTPGRRTRMAATPATTATARTHAAIVETTNKWKYID